MSILKKTDRAEGLPRFGEVMSLLPPWSLFEDAFRDLDGRQLIHVEEFTDGDAVVIRAELPGIDPDRDVEITVTGGVLCLTAERTERDEQKDKDFRRREFRYGSFARSIPLPDGVDAGAVSATYADGILEVRVPVPKAEKEPAQRIAVTRA